MDVCVVSKGKMLENQDKEPSTDVVLTEYKTIQKILLRAWMVVFCVRCAGCRLYEGMIIHCEKFYRVFVCVQMGRGGGSNVT